MTKKILILFLALAALISICAAQYYTPTQAYDNAQNESVPAVAPEIAPATGNASAPTDTRPQAGEQPQRRLKLQREKRHLSLNRDSH